jgi:hypothetical protein
MWNLLIAILLIIITNLSSCNAKSTSKNINEGITIYQEEEIKEKVKINEEFINRKTAEYMSFLKDNVIYFFRSVPSQNEGNVNYLFEVQIDANVPVLSRIDYINGEKVYIDKMILSEKRINFSENNYQLIFATNRYDGVRDWLKITEKDEIVEITAAYDARRLNLPQLNNLEEILTRLHSNKAETHAQYAGRYVFEKIEMIKKIGFEGRDPFSFLTNPWSWSVEDRNEIIISFTGAGNLHMRRSLPEENNFFSIDNDSDLWFLDHSNPDFLINWWAGGGIYDVEENSLFYFDDDYIVFYYYFSRLNEQFDDRHYIEFKIFYRKANGT